MPKPSKGGRKVENRRRHMNIRVPNQAKITRHCDSVIIAIFLFLALCGRAQVAPPVDCIKVVEEMEALAKTNLLLAVQENNVLRIDAIYENIGAIATAPKDDRKAVERRLLHLRLQTLQALFEMQERGSRVNPLYNSNVWSGTRYDEKNTEPGTIDDLGLRQRYIAWLEYRDANRQAVRKGSLVESRYRGMAWALSPWRSLEEYVPVFQEVITNQTLLRDLFPPDGVPRVVPLKKQGDP